VHSVLFYHIKTQKFSFFAHSNTKCGRPSTFQDEICKRDESLSKVSYKKSCIKMKKNEKLLQQDTLIFILISKFD
jgi:hypothetical protein